MRGLSSIISVILLVALAIALALLLYFYIMGLLQGGTREYEGFLRPLLIQHTEYSPGRVTLYVLNPNKDPIDLNEVYAYLSGPSTYFLPGSLAESDCTSLEPGRTCKLSWNINLLRGRYTVKVVAGETVNTAPLRVDASPSLTFAEPAWPMPFQNPGLHPTFPDTFSNTYLTDRIPEINYPTAYAVGDIDGDNNQEILVADWNYTTGEVVLYYMDSENPPTPLYTWDDNIPFISLFVGDVDGDGMYEVGGYRINPDSDLGYLVVVDGTAREQSLLADPRMLVDDLDLDGVDEVVFSEYTNNRLCVLDGEVRCVDVGATVHVPAAGDVDDDGNKEIVVVGEDGNLYLFTYTGTLTEKDRIALDPSPGSVEGVLIFDFYVDGKPDLAFVGDNNYLYVFLNGLREYNHLYISGRPFTVPQPFQAGGDGNLELLVVHDTNVALVAYSPSLGLIKVYDYDLGVPIGIQPPLVDENRTSAMVVTEDGKVHILSYDGSSFTDGVVDVNIGPLYLVGWTLFDPSVFLAFPGKDSNDIIFFPSPYPGGEG